MGIRSLTVGGIFVAFPWVLFVACSNSDSAEVGAPVDGGMGTGPSNFDAARMPDVLEVKGPCPIQVESPPLVEWAHVPVNTEIAFTTNPPVSGPHFPVWPEYKEYDKPVPRGYYIHNLEHGAIGFLYKCDKPGGCPEVVEAYRQVVREMPDDRLCPKSGPVRVKYIITPDPLLDWPVVVVSWGWIYRAKCVDIPSIKEFAGFHYNQGREQSCAQGQEIQF